jgi:PAS domain S-box-containing protein
VAGKKMINEPMLREQIFTILVVDDDLDFGEGLVDILETKGYRAFHVSSVADAQKKLANEDIDIAIVDVRLGRHNGIDLLSFLKAKYPSILTIVMTAYSAEEVAVQALKEGAYDYLRKPMHPHEVLKTLERCRNTLKLQQDKELAENALVTSETRLNAVINSLPGICILVDFEGRFEEIWCSDPKLLFRPREEVVGKKIEDVFPPEDAHRFLYYLKKTIETKAPQQYEYVLNVAKGDRWFEARTSYLTEADNLPKVLVLIVDITDKKRYEQEVVRNSQLASLGELASGVAHEINNPVTGIINYSQIIMDQYPEGEINEIARRINREGERIAAIVKNLLSFGREATKEYIPITIKELTDECLLLARQQLRQDSIILEIDIPDDLPMIMANPNEMQQVFVNFLNNARYALNKKYPASHPNKKLTITAKAIIKNNTEWVQFICHDRGIGIPKYLIERITQPFFTTKPPGEGTGLGLSISHKIIQQHGGLLRFESVENEYTKTIVEIPTLKN